MRLEQMNLEILEGCRATTGMNALDFAAAFGLARGAIPKNASGGTILEVRVANREGKIEGGSSGGSRGSGGITNNVGKVGEGTGFVRVYAMAKDGKFILGLRRDFELLGLQFGRFCDALDRSYDKRITG